MSVTLLRRCGAEFLGAALIVAAIVGAGIMAQRSTNDKGIVLLMGVVPPVLMLGLLITLFGPEGAPNFNPAVTFISVMRKEFSVTVAIVFVLLQTAGALCGSILANIMFALPALQESDHVRTGPGLWLGEVVGTAGLLFVGTALARTERRALGALLAPAWIGAAAFFTSSTSFANPAVTVSRAITDSVAGISPGSVPMFVLSQLVGAALGALLALSLFPDASANDARRGEAGESLAQR